MTFSGKHDLLTDALFTWQCRNGARLRGSLPELLHSLAQGEAVDFCRARPHQWHLFGMFLAQIAYHVVDLLGSEPADVAQWHDVLLLLTGEDRTAWHLIVPDETRNAFMQPASPFAQHSPKVTVTPDEIDTPVNTTNIVPKNQMVPPDDVEAWIFALIAMQTSSGYGGGGGKSPYKEVSRTANGNASRIRVGVYPALDAASMFRRDLEVMLHTRTAKWVKDASGPIRGGRRLLWTMSWDEVPVQLKDLEPHYIEVCRRIRLGETEKGLEARYAPGTRAIEKCDGVTGDPWIPLLKPSEEKDPRAFDLGSEVFESGLTYRALSVLLSGRGIQEPPAQTIPVTAGSSAFWIVAALVRSQGKTRGPFERIVEVPVDLPTFSTTEGAPDFIGLEKRFIDETKRAEQTLRRGLEEIGSHLRSRALEKFKASSISNFRRQVDHIFFERLISSVEKYSPEADAPIYTAWRETLHTMMHQEMEHALAEFVLPPVEAARRFVKAKSLMQQVSSRQQKPKQPGTQNEERRTRDKT